MKTIIRKKFLISKKHVFLILGAPESNWIELTFFLSS